MVGPMERPSLRPCLRPSFSSLPESQPGLAPVLLECVPRPGSRHHASSTCLTLSAAPNLMPLMPITEVLSRGYGEEIAGRGQF